MNSLPPSMMTCGKCRKQRAINLAECPHCGHTTPNSAGDSRPQTPTSEPQERVAESRATTAQEDHLVAAAPSRWRLQEYPQQPVQHVLVTDVHMSFGAMVTFLVKLSIAAIPAMAILAILGALLVSLLSHMR